MTRIVASVRSALVALTLFACAAPAGAEKMSTSDGLAVKGYDAVAYFTESRAIEGAAQFTHRWRDAEWRFASAANRDAFAAAPEKFAPQYGGFCAWAVSQGYTAPTDPEAFRVVEGRLYLNYNKSVQTRWVEDIPGNIAKADTNWPKLGAN